MTRTLHSAILFLALLTSLSAKDWPTKFSPSATLGKYQALEPEGELHRYATTNYLIESPIPLDRTKLANFTKTIESVAVVLKSIPLPLYAPPLNHRPRILICPDEASFIREGGPKGSAGYYSGRHARVLIRWDQLYPANATARPMDDLLVHELTHLCMTNILWRCPPWFHEGVAEYLAAAHIGGGRFDFTEIENAIESRIEKHNPPKSPIANALDPSVLLTLTERGWHARTKDAVDWEPFEPYTTSLLLIHYAFHGGAERRAEVTAYLKALDEMITRRSPRPVLFEPEQSNEIKKKLTAFWATRGLRLQFTK
ncbi:hypothetical protein N9A94_03755 [Akkermansiaceae bacterium]|nr:hypothetical protein [Akkermansiaceae bacterium]MDA7887791.1 hypothetical protein [Akkermansiaceae bacterium]